VHASLIFGEQETKLRQFLSWCTADVLPWIYEDRPRLKVKIQYKKDTEYQVSRFFAVFLLQEQTSKMFRL
jgi:hypothetical protein